MLKKKRQRRDMKCNNHPDEEAIAVYNDVGLCKSCLVDFIINVDRKINNLTPKYK